MRLKRSRSRASSCAGWRYACLLGKLKIQRISESWHEASLMEHRPSPADPGRDHRWWLWDWQALRAPSLALRETTAKTEKPRHNQYDIVYTQYYTIFTYVLTYVIYLYCIFIAWKKTKSGDAFRDDNTEERSMETRTEAQVQQQLNAGPSAQTIQQLTESIKERHWNTEMFTKMHKAQQNTTPFEDHLVLSYISFKCFLSFLVTCWIEAEWEDRGGPELVRDLEALGLEDGRDVQLPVEAGIAWYCMVLWYIPKQSQTSVISFNYALQEHTSMLKLLWYLV